MPTLKGRRFFFATRGDLAPRWHAVEQAEGLEFVRQECRDDSAFAITRTLSAHPELGSSAAGSVVASPSYLIFRRGETPSPRAVPQRGGGVKFMIESTTDSLRLICGGVHAESGALLAGELQQSLHVNSRTVELFERVARELFRGFTRVRLYWVGPEALRGLRSGQRLVTIGIASPREYDLAEKRP